MSNIYFLYVILDFMNLFNVEERNKNDRAIRNMYIKKSTKRQWQDYKLKSKMKMYELEMKESYYGLLRRGKWTALNIC